MMLGRRCGQTSEEGEGARQHWAQMCFVEQPRLVAGQERRSEQWQQPPQRVQDRSCPEPEPALANAHRSPVQYVHGDVRVAAC